MMVDRLKRNSIKDKIQLISTLQIILPIIIIGIISFVISNNIIRNQTLLRTKQSFSFVSEQVTNYTDSIFDSSYKIIYDKSIYDIISFGTPIDDSGRESIRNLLQQMVTLETDIDAVSLTLNNENFRTISKTNNIPHFDAVGYTDILEKARKSKNAVYWYTDTAIAPIGSIYLVKLIYNPYTYEEVGNIILQTSSVSLINMMEQYNTTSESMIDIISSHDRYIYKADGSNKDFELSNLSFEENVLTRHRGTYLIYQNIHPIDWQILCTLDSGKLFEASIWLMLCIFLLCALSATVLVLFTRYINRNISSPLSELAKQIQIWDEDTVFKNPYKQRHDEIGVLYRSFSQMTRRITNLIKQNYRNKLLQKDIEYKMLQSQIMPHFMFNALSVINNMALLNDVPEISKMVTALSDTLNSRIGRDGGYVTLDEEISASDSYVYIQSVRFDNRLQVTKNISPEAKTIPIPHLTIQPIVENAVKYGLEVTEGKCIITITAYIDGSDLVVTVSDNGIGIEPNKLNEIRHSLKTNASSINGSIGLINVNKRLTLLYGEEYGITINSEFNRFTTITLKYKIQDA